MTLLGPLVINQDGKYLLLGITSFGRGCDFIPKESSLDYNVDNNTLRLSGVYTNVEYFVDWIKDNSDYTECNLRKLGLARLG